MAEFLRSRPVPDCEIGEIRSQHPRAVLAFTLVDEMAKRLDIFVGKQLAEVISAIDWQHLCDRVELGGPPLHARQAGGF